MKNAKKTLPVMPYMDAPSLLNRIIGAVQLLVCKGHLTQVSADATAVRDSTTGHLYLDFSKPVDLIAWQCGEGNKNCHRCPRLQTYWEIKRFDNAIRGEQENPPAVR